MSEDKIPSEETGTYSTYFSDDNRKIINRLDLDGIGPGPLLTKVLERAEKHHEIKKSYRRFLEGDIPLGSLMRELNQL